MLIFLMIIDILIKLNIKNHAFTGDLGSLIWIGPPHMNSEFFFYSRNFSDENTKQVINAHE